MRFQRFISVPKLSAPPRRLLFIGNSFTYAHKGIGCHIELLAAAADPPFAVKTDAVIRGGASLRTMWQYTKARQAINRSSYDAVVLQEDIPESDVATFHIYVRKFAAAIKKTGAAPVLFMAWAYERLGWISMEEIAQAHDDIAMELGIAVAPVGLAWQQAMAERPTLDMYGSDREHPSIHGTYLAVNVLYATLFEQNPTGLSSRFTDKMDEKSSDREEWHITEDEIAFLQRIAWDTVRKYHTPREK